MGDAEPVEVTVRIEQQQPNQHVVQTSQPEQIGALLRGNSKHDVLTIVLPIVIPIIISGIISYFTWLASMQLQRATDRAEKGASSYQRAAMAIDQRWNATNDFVATIKNVVKPPSKRGDANSGLYKAALDLQSSRWTSYYNALKAWKEEYDGILADIDYALDRPVLSRIDPKSLIPIDPKYLDNKITRKKTDKVTCEETLSLVDQLRNAHYIRYSLKAQFATIGSCLDRIDKELGQPQTIIGGAPTSSGDIATRLNTVETMSNSFRCYADWRLQYFYKLKQNATLTALTFGIAGSDYDTSKDDTCELPQFK